MPMTERLIKRCSVLIGRPWRWSASGFWRAAAAGEARHGIMPALRNVSVDQNESASRLVGDGWAGGGTGETGCGFSQCTEGVDGQYASPVQVARRLR
jgi:hypothetical protein